jgi:hypothetical protein
MTLDDVSLAETVYGLYKDELQNKLSFSPLQLAQHTLLIIHEKELLTLTTPLLDSPGNNTRSPPDGTSVAEKNLEILRNAILHQRLQIDFQFYHLDLPLSFPVIIFSDHHPSLCFQSEKLISIKYQPTPVLDRMRSSPAEPLIAPPCVEFCSKEEFPCLPERLYEKIWWSRCLEMNPFIETTSALVQRIEEDYVQARQQDNLRSPLSNPDDLHNLLTLTRLYAASCQDKEITSSHWEYILYLEEARNSRS